MMKNKTKMTTISFSDRRRSEFGNPSLVEALNQTMDVEKKLKIRGRIWTFIARGDLNLRPLCLISTKSPQPPFLVTFDLFRGQGLMLPKATRILPQAINHFSRPRGRLK